VGYDDDEPTGFTGSQGALPIWARIMAHLPARSFEQAMPESLAEVHIEYPTGLRAVGGCADHIIAIAVPPASPPLPKPGCAFPDGQAPGLIERAKQALEHLVH